MKATTPTASSGRSVSPRRRAGSADPAFQPAPLPDMVRAPAPFSRLTPALTRASSARAVRRTLPGRRPSPRAHEVHCPLRWRDSVQGRGDRRSSTRRTFSTRLAHLRHVAERMELSLRLRIQRGRWSALSGKRIGAPFEIGDDLSETIGERHCGGVLHMPRLLFPGVRR